VSSCEGSVGHALHICSAPCLPQRDGLRAHFVVTVTVECRTQVLFIGNFPHPTLLWCNVTMHHANAPSCVCAKVCFSNFWHVNCVPHAAIQQSLCGPQHSVFMKCDLVLQAGMQAPARSASQADSQSQMVKTFSSESLSRSCSWRLSTKVGSVDCIPNLIRSRQCLPLI